MSRNVTLSQLRTDIAAQCDFTTSSSGRYPPTLLNRLINQSIQRFRERISNEGITHFLVSSSGTLPAGRTSPYSFQSLDLSALNPSLVRTYGIDITIAGVVRSLEHRPFTERNEFIDGPDMVGQPIAWAHFQSASVAIMPAPDTAYPYTVWYLPLLADLSADGDTFDGVAGWEIYILWDCVCQLIARDQYQAAYAQAVLERDKAWEDIIRSATKVSSAGGAFLGRDTLGKVGLWGRGRMRDIGPNAGQSSLPPQSSVTNSMLVNRNGPIVIGRLLTTGGQVEDVPIPSLTSYMSVFAGGLPGTVPSGTGNPADSLRGDGSWGNTTVGASGLSITALAPIPSPRLLGRVSAGSGPVEALTPTAVATLFPVFNSVDKGLVPGGSNGSTTTYLRGDGAWGTPSGFGVDQILPIQSPRILGRFTTGSGAVEQLVGAQVASMVPWFDTTRAGLVPYPSGISGKFLKDDGTWASAGGGGGTISNLPGGPTGSVQYNAGSGVFGGASGFLWDGSALQRFGDLSMPTGSITFGMTGTAQATPALLHFQYGNSIIAAGNASGMDAVLAGWGTAARDRLQFGNAGGGVVRIDEIRSEANRTSWSTANTKNGEIDANHLGLGAGKRLGLQQMAFPTGYGDKLAGWTPSGFANVATGIYVMSSGMALGFGARPAATGTLRFTNLAKIFVSSSMSGVDRRVLEMGDNLSVGSPDEDGSEIFYDVSSTGRHMFRTGLVHRAWLSGSGMIMQGNSPYMRAGASGAASHASGFSIGENLFGATKIHLANAAPPSSVPSGGGELFIENGALKYYGPSGTITTLGAA